MAKAAKKEKKTWVVRALGWTGKPSRTVKNGITIYKPGEHFGWRDIKTFNSAREADDWVCRLCREKGYLITDFTIVAR